MFGVELKRCEHSHTRQNEAVVMCLTPNCFQCERRDLRASQRIYQCATLHWKSPDTQTWSVRSQRYVYVLSFRLTRDILDRRNTMIAYQSLTLTEVIIMMTSFEPFSRIQIIIIRPVLKTF